eukprot:3006275-Pleurochrysis_carterae.AAC.1
MLQACSPTALPNFLHSPLPPLPNCAANDAMRSDREEAAQERGAAYCHAGEHAAGKGYALSSCSQCVQFHA